MKISSIELKDFRNYKYEKVNLADNLNLLIGENAQGKTNLLEGIYFSTIGKSFRTNKESDLINWDSNHAETLIEFKKIGGSKKISVRLNKVGKKMIKINGVGITKISELIGTMNAVLFSPSDLDIVQDSPTPRRTFIDISISQINKSYFYFLNRYQKILAERNKLLKSRKSEKTIYDTISIWNEALANFGSKIIMYRIKFISLLSKYAKAEHLYLTSGKDDLDIYYAGITAENEREIEKILISEYEKNFEKDLNLGYTSIGPHRDDIKLIVNDKDARTFGSQGQQRTIALSLKLAELEIYKDETGEYPILLLDDVLSELDTHRQSRLLEKSTKIQTIITSTHIPKETPSSANIIKIKNAKLI